jgi:hypothetical protein
MEHQVTRGDCQACRFITDCGQIFDQVGKCPSNSGGEAWAKFTPKIPRTERCVVCEKVHIVQVPGQCSKG